MTAPMAMPAMVRSSIGERVGEGGGGAARRERRGWVVVDTGYLWSRGVVRADRVDHA